MVRVTLHCLLACTDCEAENGSLPSLSSYTAAWAWKLVAISGAFIARSLVRFWLTWPKQLPPYVRSILRFGTPWLSCLWTDQKCSPVTDSSILLYSSRVCPNSEILLLSPLEDENHAKPTLFPQFPGKEAINFQRCLVSFRFLAIIFILELIC